MPRAWCERSPASLHKRQRYFAMTFMHHRKHINQDDFLAAPAMPFLAAQSAGNAHQVKGSITMGMLPSQAIGQQQCRSAAAPSGALRALDDRRYRLPPHGFRCGSPAHGLENP